MKTYYITTGYMGSGSSAVTGLLREIKGISVPNGEFEYVFLHSPNGIFDLEDKLLLGNNALRSDEAIHSFQNYMEDLFSKRFYGVGNYKKLVSPDFILYVKSFLDELQLIHMNGKFDSWYYKENPSLIMFFQRIIRKMIKTFTLNRINPPYSMNYYGMTLSFPTPECFYSAAHRFIYKVMDKLRENSESVVFDQLLLPHNLFRLDRYFDDDVKVIVVDRDPRDVFLLNKYYWIHQGSQVPFPNDVNDFCHVYRRMREIVRQYDEKRVVSIHFEDLIYKYDETIEYLLNQLEIDPQLHIHKKTYFNPDVSIANTYVEKYSAEYQEESNFIRKELSEYIYDFPLQQKYYGEVSKIF